MTLIDTSAWVEFLRATGSPVHRQVREMLATEETAQTTEVIVMEVLAGGRDPQHVRRLRTLLARCEFVPSVGLADHEDAAALYRRCRRAGETVRALNDCLIAAIAIRAGVEVLHADRDFEVLDRHTELAVRQRRWGG